MKYLKPRFRPIGLYEIEGPWDIGDPVHENLALAALYQQRNVLGLAGQNFNSLWSGTPLNEFLRGVFWNDDPEVLMFDHDTSDDANFSSGTEWYIQFEAASMASSNDKTNLTGRSHFWDMQFVHGMACVSGEAAQTTRQNALMWAEFMYKVAIGQPVNGVNTNTISTPEAVAATTLSSVRIPSAGSQSTTISSLFGSNTKPTASQTIKVLLTEGDPFQSLDIGKRAIGSVMHLIQDSFARGHTRRVLNNPGDVQSQDLNSITFKPGKYGDWGNVITFHSYKGQDGAHSKFDAYDPSGGMDPTNLSTFNNLVGGRNAIDYCTQLLSFYSNKTLYESENGPQHLMETIFALDANATVSDTNVNRIPVAAQISLFNTGTGSLNNADPHYQLVNSNGTTSTAYIVQPNGAWVNSVTSAKWISPAASTQGAAGPFVYRTTINLQGINPSTLVISGRCAADDTCTGISVNGKSITYAFGKTTSPVTGGGTVTLPAPGPGYTKYGSFTISGSDIFTNGANTIDFHVTNAGTKSNPTGVVVIIDSANAVPS